MTLSQLKAFLKVLETGSFSEAALGLGVSQASVSQAVAELERELELKLFNRGRFGAKPTEAGSRLEAHANKVLQFEAAFLQEARLLGGRLRGTVRVATFQSISKKLMPGLITELKEPYPELSVRLVETDSDSHTIAKALKEGRAEVGFTSLPVSQNFISWELIRDPYLVLVPESFLRVEPGLDWQALGGKTLITYEDFQEDGCTTATRYFRKTYGPLEAVYEVKETSTILSLIAQGIGFSILPSYTAEPLPPGVVALPLTLPFERILSVAVMPEALRIPGVRVFLSALRPHFPQSDLPVFKNNSPQQPAPLKVSTE